MERMPFTEDKNVIFKRLEETASRANLTEAEQEQYEAEWKYYNDYFNTIDYAKKEGREEGRAEGREEGLAEGRTENMRMIVTNMNAENFEVSVISKCTGLSEDEVTKIIKSLS